MRVAGVHGVTVMIDEVRFNGITDDSESDLVNCHTSNRCEDALEYLSLEQSAALYYAPYFFQRLTFVFHQSASSASDKPEDGVAKVLLSMWDPVRQLSQTLRRGSVFHILDHRHTTSSLLIINIETTARLKKKSQVFSKPLQRSGRCPSRRN